MEANNAEKKLRVLLVDDDESIRATYAAVFNSEGFDVLEAEDGLEGLNIAMSEKPDIIFTGIIMPKMDGFALKDALSKNAVTTNIPVFMSSHMGREEDRKRASEVGVKDFFILGMVTPKRVVEEIRAMFSAKKYYLSFSPDSLDANDLSSDFHLNPGFKCEKCTKQKILSLEIQDVNKKEFKARFICPDCK